MVVTDVAPDPKVGAYGGMHPFPPASDLQFLVGRQLELICLGLWQSQFAFDVGSISVEGDLEHVDSEGTVRRHNTDNDRPNPLFVHHLIGQKIMDLRVEPFCLTLKFERDILRIYSEDGPYECGQIYDDANQLTVF